MRRVMTAVAFVCVCRVMLAAEEPPSPAATAREWWKPYSPPCAERENVFEFTEKPAVKNLGNDKYEITFAVKGNCDVAVGIVDGEGRVVRHLGAGVLGANAPAPFQKNSLKQTLYWNGKDDLDEYHKTPDKLKVRVMLGLKPVFDKRLGGTSPKNLPGSVVGLALGPDGAYVIGHGGGFGSANVRKFDRDGKYVHTLVPPSANLPDSKREGMGYVEFEPGKRTLHGPDVDAAVSSSAYFLPGYTLDSSSIDSCQPVVVGNRLVFANAGCIGNSPGSFLHYICTDGATDARGIKGMRLVKPRMRHTNWRLAVSPDGKTVYMTGAQNLSGAAPCTFVYARSLESEEPGRIFAGEFDKPGSDERHFNDAQGIDCDAEGRVYVADTANNRIQVFSPQTASGGGPPPKDGQAASGGKYLKTIQIDRPDLICVHKKTGAIYVLHMARVQGASVGRLTKLVSFADPQEEFHWDGVSGLMALDSWSERPRLWWSGIVRRRNGGFGDAFMTQTGSGSVTIWEERDRKFEKVADFEADAIKEAGKGWYGRWSSSAMNVMGIGAIVCDPIREKGYYGEWYSHMFDLVTGAYEGCFRSGSEAFDDLAFDKRGYVHGHQNNRDSRGPCVWRGDPARSAKKKEGGIDTLRYPECPYDYGVEKAGWKGCLPTRCQAGAKGFQDGLGVNMRGEIVVESNIYYVPKMQDEGEGLAMAGSKAITASGQYNEEGNVYGRMMKAIAEAQKLGEEVFSVRRQPGIPLAGATIWTFDRSGELRNQNPAVVGGLLAGVQMDEDGFIYFTMDRTRLLGGKVFLDGKGGIFGTPSEGKKLSPFTGTYVKARPEKLRILAKNAPIPMDQPPPRAPDVAHEGDAWVEGAEWLYAGACPIVSGNCSCPSSRFHLDWYKRSYVPELYRHSFAILDTNGNLIMRVGRYANFDGAPGAPDGCRPGSEDIGLTAARYLSGTDNHLAFQDYGDRIVVLKLNYHAEETVGIGNQ